MILDVGIDELVLDRERLELGRLDPAALLARLEHRLRALGLKQFRQLVLSQVDSMSFRFCDRHPQTFRTVRHTPPFQRNAANRLARNASAPRHSTPRPA